MSSQPDSQAKPRRLSTKAEAGKYAVTVIDAAVAAEVNGLPPETDESQALFQLEVTKFQLQKMELDNSILQEGLADRRADRELRKKYADLSFRFLIGFSVFAGAVLVAQGLPFVPFKLAESIIIALISSTAVAVVGLVGWVARGLFKAPGS